MRKVLNLMVLVATVATASACGEQGDAVTAAPVLAAASPIGVAPANTRLERVVPSMKDGKAYGFKLYAMRAESKFARAGCQNGDTIIAIDGQPATEAEALMNMGRALEHGGEVKLTIVRKGDQLAEPLLLRL